MTIKKRIFLVGCPRSGTTLLQSFLAAHSQIASFPESKFFQRLIYPNTIRGRLGIASKKAISNFNQFLTDINHEEKKALLPKNAIFVRQHAEAFIKALDTITTQENKNCWLEKTPAHIQRIKYIEKFVPQCKFIHIIRNGKDVVASLYEVTHKYPEIWNGAWDIDKCIQRWIKDVQISNLYFHKTNHLLIEYDSFIESQQIVLKKICGFINIPFDKSILKNRVANVEKLIRPYEEWKQSVSTVLQNNKYQKFDKLFDERQKKYIIKQIEEVNYETN